MSKNTMPQHRIGTPDEWLKERLNCSTTKRSSRAERRAGAPPARAPWVRVDKHYRFETEDGQATLADLFRGKLAVARLPLHVRCRLYRRLSVVLVDCRRIQRLRDSPRPSRRHALRGFARADRKAARPTRSAWAGRFRGRRRSAATSTSTSKPGAREEQQQSGTIEYNFRPKIRGRRLTLDAPLGDSDRRRLRNGLADVSPGNARRERVRA